MTRATNGVGLEWVAAICLSGRSRLNAPLLGSRK